MANRIVAAEIKAAVPITQFAISGVLRKEKRRPMRFSMLFRRAVFVSVIFLSACSGQSSDGSAVVQFPVKPASVVPVNTGSAVRPYTPGIDAKPDIAHAPAARPLTPAEIVQEAIMAAELTDPHRPVLRNQFASTERSIENVVQGGNGEAVGLFTPSAFSAQGSVVNIGVQLNYYVQVGGNFFHTHQFVNNQCFEYGINYAAQPPTLFGYNWCTGGNTPQGFMNMGLVGDPNGVLNTWKSNGNGALLAWDSVMGTYKMSLEEVQETDGS